MCKFCVGTDKRRYEKQPCASQDNHRDVVTGAGNICFQLVQRLSASNFEKSTVCAPESELKKSLKFGNNSIYLFSVSLSTVINHVTLATSCSDQCHI
jgi:hypothetical protein